MFGVSDICPANWFTYHIVYIKQKVDNDVLDAAYTFTYHIVYIKLVVFVSSIEVPLPVFTYHIVYIKLYLLTYL